jgi:hypothetical protein
LALDMLGTAPEFREESILDENPIVDPENWTTG